MNRKLDKQGLWIFMCLIAVFAIAKHFVTLPEELWLVIFDIVLQSMRMILR